MNKTDIQPSQIHDIAAAELRQIFIDAVLYGFRPQVLIEKANMPVGAEGLNRQAYAFEILEHILGLRPPSIATAKAARMDAHFGAALHLQWPQIEKVAAIKGSPVENLFAVAEEIADNTIKSCAPAVKTRHVPEAQEAEIVQLAVRRPLRVQFEMAANILDDFDLEDYHLAGIVEREKKILDLAEDMALAIENDKMPTDDLQRIIHGHLTVGFNSLYFIGDHKPAPEHVEDNFDITKATIIDGLSSRAREVGLNL